MTSTSLPSTAELHARYQRGLNRFYDGIETSPVLLCKHISRSAANAFADDEEAEGHPRFSFVKELPSGDDDSIQADDVGSLYFRWDRTAIHEAVMHDIGWTLHHLHLLTHSIYSLTGDLIGWAWLHPLGSPVIPTIHVLDFGGGPRVQLPSGFYEPDYSLLVRRGRTAKRAPTLVLEVGYIRSRQDLEQDMGRLVGPTGPARLALGVDIEHTTNPQPGEVPRIEVLLQRRGEPRPRVVAQCGAGSGCTTYGMYDSTLYLPVDELLYGVPYLLRLAVKVLLAVWVPLIGVLLGGLCGVWSVLRGRRSVLSVACGFVRSLWGPWWGVVPLDLYIVRDAVFSGQLIECRSGSTTGTASLV